MVFVVEFYGDFVVERRLLLDSTQLQPRVFGLVPAVEGKGLCPVASLLLKRLPDLAKFNALHCLRTNQIRHPWRVLHLVKGVLS